MIPITDLLSPYHLLSVIIGLIIGYTLGIATVISMAVKQFKDQQKKDKA